MRVLVIGPDWPDSFADNVSTTFAEMGHEVIRAGGARRGVRLRRVENALNVASDYASRLDVRQQRHLIRTATDFHPEIVLTVDARLRRDTVERLREVSGPVILWHPDHVANMGKHEMFVSGYDIIFLKNPILARQLRNVYGIPARYLPEAANPAWHKPMGEYGTDRVIEVAGNIHPTRAILLRRLVSAGVPLRLHGPPMSSWMPFPDLRAIHTGQMVTREGKARAFRSARGVLNNLHPGEYAGSNCRMFEATAAGGVLITENRPGMSELFDSNEMLTFANFDELVFACESLLSDQVAGRMIADAGSRRTLRNHTYEARLTEILACADVGIKRGRTSQDTEA